MTEIYRHEVPCDGNWHEIDLTGGVRHLGSRRTNTVEIYGVTEEHPKITFKFIAVQTGEQIPKGSRYVDTVTDAGGYFVWHLFSQPV